MAGVGGAAEEGVGVILKRQQQLGLRSLAEGVAGGEGEAEVRTSNLFTPRAYAAISQCIAICSHAPPLPPPTHQPQRWGDQVPRDQRT